MQLCMLPVALLIGQAAFAQVVPDSQSLYDAYQSPEAEIDISDTVDYRPRKGQFAMGFDAIPILDFGLNAVNIMNDTGQKATGLNSFVSGYDQTLYGKYYWSNTMAIRVRLAFNLASVSDSFNSDNPIDILNGADNVGEVTTTTTATSSNFLFGGGVEWRHGEGRFQAFYGAEGLIGFGGNSTSITYGWNYGQQAADLGAIQSGTRRSLGTTDGFEFSIGARGFAGLEFFMLKDISLSAEFGWAMAYTSKGRQGETFEVWQLNDEGVGSVIEEEEDISAGGSTFRMGVDNGVDARLSGPTGAIVLTFHI